jgi:hypothetical protein
MKSLRTTQDMLGFDTLDNAESIDIELSRASSYLGIVDIQFLYQRALKWSQDILRK